VRLIARKLRHKLGGKFGITRAAIISFSCVACWNCRRSRHFIINPVINHAGCQPQTHNKQQNCSVINEQFGKWKSHVPSALNAVRALLLLNYEWKFEPGREERWKLDWLKNAFGDDEIYTNAYVSISCNLEPRAVFPAFVLVPPVSFWDGLEWVLIEKPLIQQKAQPATFSSALANV